MKVALLEMYADDKMATGERARALKTFLENGGHSVDVIAPSPQRLNDFYRFRFSLASRLRRRLLRRAFLPHLWEFIADEILPQITGGDYDVVIGRLQPVAYALTRCNRRALRIFDTANIGFLESYHGWNADMSEVEREYAMEMAIYESVDHVILHHPILADFFKRHVYDDPKVQAIRMGCYLSDRRAVFSEAPRLVYAGSYSYIQDPYLLSLVTRQSPYPIDCYGHKDPNFSFLPAPVNYRGFSQEPFLSNYQCGVITVSQDRLRRHSPSTKFAYYFAHGLPVLFPEWMEEGHTYAAAVPFTESTFADQARRTCGDRERWHELSEAAYEAARDLTWDRVLQPFEALLRTHDATRKATQAPALSGAAAT